MLPLVDNRSSIRCPKKPCNLARQHHHRHRPGKKRESKTFRRQHRARELSSQRGKTEQLDEIRKISNMINVAYVRQGEPLGLGHAVLVTADMVGNEPFAVILADDVIDATPPALKQMIDVFERVGGPVLAVERVPEDQVSNYGIVDIDSSANLGAGVYAVKDLVEKPARGDAPSNLAIIGRYLLTPTSFRAPRNRKRRTGEIQLTNCLRRLLIQRQIFACEVRAPARHATARLLQAVVYSRSDALTSEQFRSYLRSTNIEPAPSFARQMKDLLPHSRKEQSADDYKVRLLGRGRAGAVPVVPTMVRNCSYRRESSSFLSLCPRAFDCPSLPRRSGTLRA